MKFKKRKPTVTSQFVMKIKFNFITLKLVKKYGIFRNNKNTDKLSQNNFHNFQNNIVYFKGVTFVLVLINGVGISFNHRIRWQNTVCKH